MITKDNFKATLLSLGYRERKNILSFGSGASKMEADFTALRLKYPSAIKIHGDFTTNFLGNENFVVFECVHRLILLGYEPAHLTLEPKWTVGHGGSGGRADIMIKDYDGKVFAIIECKTAGAEFN